MTRQPLLVRILAAAGTLLALLGPRPASADLSDAVYSDVKDVIEDLLTKEVSESVTPTLACLSGRTQGKEGNERLSGAIQIGKDGYVRLEATRHFPRTLQHIFDR